MTKPAGLAVEVEGGAVTTTAPANPTPVSAHLASGVLPAAGAYTNQAVWTIESGTVRIGVKTTYTRGAVGGFARGRAMWTWPDATETEGTVRDNTLDVSAAPIARRQIYLAEDVLPMPVDGNPLGFDVWYDVEPGATGFRYELCEAGVTATPGTGAVALSGSKQ